MATDFDWAGFRALIKRLDELIGAAREDAEYAQDVRRALTFIYTAGITMPTAGDVYDAAGGDEFWKDTVNLEGELAEERSVEQAVAALSHRLAASVMAAQDDDEIDTEELADLADTAAQGLHDAYTGISAGARYFGENRMDEAAWEWSFGFDEWGSNAVASMQALHELLWGAR